SPSESIVVSSASSSPSSSYQMIDLPPSKPPSEDPDTKLFTHHNRSSSLPSEIISKSEKQSITQSFTQRMRSFIRSTSRLVSSTSLLAHSLTIDDTSFYHTLIFTFFNNSLCVFEMCRAFECQIAIETSELERRV